MQKSSFSVDALDEQLQEWAVILDFARLAFSTKSSRKHFCISANVCRVYYGCCKESLRSALALSIT